MKKHVIVSAVFKVKSPNNKRILYVGFEGNLYDDFTPRLQLIDIIEKNPENVFVKIDGIEHKVWLTDSHSENGTEKVVRCSASYSYGGDDLGKVYGGIFSKDLEKIDLIDLYVLELIRDGKINERVISQAQCKALPSYGYIEVDKSGAWSLTETGLNQLNQLDHENPLKRYNPKTNTVVDAE